MSETAISIIEKVNDEKIHIINNNSHGVPNGQVGMGMNPSFKPWEQADLGDMTNSNPFFAYLGDCFSGWFDKTPHTLEADNYCFCEDMVRIEHGAFGAICHARVGTQKVFHNEFWDAIISEKLDSIGEAFDDSKEDNIGYIDTVRGAYYWQHLFGDPAAKLIYNRIPKVLNGSDFDGSGGSDISIYRSNIGLWAIRNFSRIYYGAKTDIPVNGDYDGDGTADIAIFRKTNGLWAIRNLQNCYYGTSTDMPIPADYNGDGTTNIAVFRLSSGRWAIKSISVYYFGNHMDIPTVLDYNGDGTEESAIFRPSSGLWAIRNIGNYYFGRGDDLPIPADYDGDGSDDICIYRPSNNLWAVKNVTRVYYGDTNTYYCMPVPADYDGDNLGDIGIFRPTNGLWAVKGITKCYYGSYSDYPVASTQ